MSCEQRIDFRQAPTREEYTIAWICPLQVELTAAMAMLDEVHQPLPQPYGDDNSYVLGKVHKHSVVLACLGYDTGTNAARHVSQDLRRAFPNISQWLLVGVGGGVPSKLHDIRLGDVVVGRRVIPCNPKKQFHDASYRTSPIQYPPDRLYKVVDTLGSVHNIAGGNQILSTLSFKRASLARHRRPGLVDKLFTADSIHQDHDVMSLTSHVPDANRDPCQNCDTEHLIERAPRKSTETGPMVHYGDIASGDTLLRSGEVRDLMMEELKVACVEMEAGGLHRDLPCLVVRGIADYADSHKNKEWQGYAAAAAAAYVRELLELLPPTSSATITIDSLLDSPPESWQDRRKKEVLESLSFEYMDSRRLGIEDQHDTTCEWLLNQPEYTSWLDGSSHASAKYPCLLWLRGNPGAGKSTLMRFAFEAHQKRLFASPREHQGQTELLVSFFFNARGHELEHSVTGMYQQLLVQMFEKCPDLQDLLLDPNFIPSNNKLSIPILRRVLKAAISSLGQRRMVCYIDALDECDDKDMRGLMETFQDITEAHESDRRFRVFISSRYYGSLTQQADTVIKLEATSGHTRDLTCYIEDRLLIRNIPGLERLLLRKANGIFLWLVLVIRILNENEEEGLPCNVNELETELPDELYELFRSILGRNKTKYSLRKSKISHNRSNLDEFEVAVTWILYGYPMDVDDFPHAIEAGLAVKRGAVDLDQPATTGKGKFKADRRVVSATRGLAEIKYHTTGISSESRVQFIHESVRTFLEDGELETLLPGSTFGSPSLCHERLKQYCLWFITCPSSKKFVDGLFEARPVSPVGQSHVTKATNFRMIPFLQYATANVLYHANMAGSHVSQKAFISKFPEPSWRRARAAGRGPLTRPPLPPSLNSSKLANLLTSKEYDLAATPQKLFPQMDRKMLLDTSSQSTFLHYMSGMGLVHLVKSTAFPQDDKLQLNARNGRGNTPLYEAARSGHLEILAMLLEWGAEVDAVGQGRRTPLLCSAKQGHEAVTAYLIDKGASLDASDDEGYTVCHFAALRAWSAVLRSLVRLGVSVNSKARNGHTPLMMIACHDTAEFDKNDAAYEAAVQVLLRAGGDADAADFKGQTTLAKAAVHGHGRICELLLDAGAATGRVDYLGYTELMQAAGSQRTTAAAITALVTRGRGIDASIARHDGTTPLMLAAATGECSTMRVLLGHGAEINARAHGGMTAFELASESTIDPKGKLLVLLEHAKSTGQLGSEDPASYYGHDIVAGLSRSRLISEDTA